MLSNDHEASAVALSPLHRKTEQNTLKISEQQRLHEIAALIINGDLRRRMSSASERLPNK